MCRLVLAADSRCFDALNLLGIIAAQTRRQDEAAALLKQAVVVNPQYADVHSNLGNLLRELGRFEEARQSIEIALSIRPDFAEAHNNRGLALLGLKRFSEALQSFELALCCKPEFPEVYHNRGLALNELHRFHEAVVSFDRALSQLPRYAEAHRGRSEALMHLQRLSEALISCRRALEINPELHWLLGNWLYLTMKLCEWGKREGGIAQLHGSVAQGKNVIQPLAAVALVDDLSLHRQVATIWANTMHPANPEVPAIAKWPRHDKIRIGYYSADFHNHATAYLMAELFERHDRQRFELTAFSFGVESNDEMRRRLTAAFDHFEDVRTKSDLEIAQMSRAREIDIAVDLKGFTHDARTGIFACRAAPIQLSYLGYPGTMGAGYIDYLAADPVLIPPDRRQCYAEKIVYLPNSYQVNDRQRRIADKVFSRLELGLPSSGFVYCCFNDTYKITPVVFDVWMRILKQVPDSVLWLLTGDITVQDNLRREAQKRDVNAARLVFSQRMPLSEHLARHGAADLFLDTWPYNAHTTASDALWASLPVLTAIGESFAARVAASLLSAVGLPELIASSPGEYEALAVALAMQRDRLTGFKARLHKNRLTKPLFDSAQFTRHLEAAYTEMVNRYQAGLAPDDIHIHP